MGDIVYLDYDAETLFAEYNNRGKVPDFEAFIADFEARSDRLRADAKNGRIDLAYGDGPRDRFDLFLPDVPSPPLHVFIHGGYWQWNDKESYAFLAKPFLDSGIGFANLEYPLCPGVTLAELVDHVRTGIAHIWIQGPDLGYDRDRIQVSGHSAGGHLTGVVLTTDWTAFDNDLPANIVKSAMPISGIFDLEPIRHTPIGDPLGLDAVSAAALSPMFALPRTRANTVVALGSHEGREFHRQAEAFAVNCRNHGADVTIASVHGGNHFSVLESLATSDGQLFGLAREMLSR
ncbi:MAG: alpha/beta hydrolase [Rhodospirillaceae bacterium]|jgi:arylformamidase|nr:alpha/beta hydrolase [Rhodospirillaceae bacterium]MBT6402791.1 alpha/beta hydrolase [Rhodospirillaceae bacterium]MBT6537581.1 alpha/beta hydrolase [Rhodospirillaceae bacterium]